jgi:hypothetical protein
MEAGWRRKRSASVHEIPVPKADAMSVKAIEFDRLGVR